MEVTEKYKDLAERKVKIDLRESQGLRMLTDNFDPDWKSGEEPYGTMTFTDEPMPVASIEPVRDLAAEIDALKARIERLERIGKLR